MQATCAGKTVMVRAYADRLSFIHNAEVVGTHRRQFGRDKTVFDPWHYLDVLKYKPGALRNGAPFVSWDLPVPLQQTRTLLSDRCDGDRQFVGILAAVPTHGAARPSHSPLRNCRNRERKLEDQNQEFRPTLTL
ncbi:MAG: hypothetical protein IH614_08700 [Desulfuromonadales bacterium]|nr:hypothetical protein [Desulfuromonadales bacterium]